MKLMDADAFVDLIMGEPPEPHYPDWYAAAARKMPEIQAEPVRHGEWIGGELGHCSVCGHEGCASDIWSGCNGKLFCPNCGAVMDAREGET